MDLEDRPRPTTFRFRHHDLAVEAAAQSSARSEHVRPLVAAIRMILIRLEAVHLASSWSVSARARHCRRRGRRRGWRPTASISSDEMMQGRFSGCSNMCATRLAPTPTTSRRRSEPEMVRTAHWPAAIARASASCRCGRPDIEHAARDAPAGRWNFPGRAGIDDLLNPAWASSTPRVLEVSHHWRLGQRLGGLLPEAQAFPRAP